MAQQYTIRPEVLEAESGSEIKKFAFYLDEFRTMVSSMIIVKGAHCRPEYYARFSTLRTDGWIKDDYDEMLEAFNALKCKVNSSNMSGVAKEYFIRQLTAIRRSCRDIKMGYKSRPMYRPLRAF